MQYEVQVNGKTVWTGEGPDEFDKNTFPVELRVRPEKGSSDEVTLLTDGNVISVNRAEDAPTPEPEQVDVAEITPADVANAADILGVGGGVADDAEGAGG